MSFTDLLSFKVIELENYTLTLYNLIGAILLLIATGVGIKLLKKILYKYFNSSSVDKRRQYSLYLIVKYLTWVIAFTLSLEIIGVQVTILIASSAALFVGLGLGLQQIFNDLVSGLFLLFEGSISVGDIMEVDGIIGKVDEINLRTSTIVTRDNIMMIIPNHYFVSEKVINWSHNTSKTRFNVSVGIAYGSDTALAKKTLLKCASEISEINADPQPFVRFENFGDSALIFQLYFWSEEIFVIENIKSDLRFLIDQQFRENNIVIAFPQMDIHVKSSDSNNISN